MREQPPYWPYPPLGSSGWLSGAPDDTALAAVRQAALTAVRRRTPRGAPPDLETALGVLSEMAERVDWALLAVVGQARSAGWSWDDVGRALGVTRQAAHRRFAPWVAEALARAEAAAGSGTLEA